MQTDYRVFYSQSAGSPSHKLTARGGARFTGPDPATLLKAMKRSNLQHLGTECFGTLPEQSQHSDHNGDGNIERCNDGDGVGTVLSTQIPDWFKR
jgi:hypothetical protein